MRPPHMLAREPAQPEPLWRSVSAELWKRRWKVAGLVTAYAVGRSCSWWPDWAEPACGLVSKLLGLLGAS